MAKTLEDAATKGSANTALGLSIGALGLKLLPNILGWSGEGGELDLFGGRSAGFRGHRGHVDGHDWELQREIFGTTVNLQGGIYQSRIDTLSGDFANYRYTDREVDRVEERCSNLEKQVAVLLATQPLQAQITRMEIEAARVAAHNELERETALMINGTVVLPNATTVTGIPSGAEPEA